MTALRFDQALRWVAEDNCTIRPSLERWIERFVRKAARKLRFARQQATAGYFAERIAADDQAMCRRRLKPSDKAGKRYIVWGIRKLRCGYSNETASIVILY